MTQIRLLTAADGVMTEAQTLTPEQKAQVLENLGIVDTPSGNGTSAEMTDTVFLNSIKLDLIAGRNYGTVRVTDNAEVGLSITSIKNNAFAQIGLIGDGTHEKLFSAFNKYDTNGLDFDKTNDMLNVYMFFRIFDKVYYTIIDAYEYVEVDTIAPVLADVLADLITATTVTVKLTSNEVATLYYAIYDADEIEKT